MGITKELDEQMKKLRLWGALLFALLFSSQAAFAADTCSAHRLNLSLLTDNYASETSWKVLRGRTLVASGSDYSNNKQYTETLCLEDGDYSFIIDDSYNDGICCGYGSGSYSLTANGSSLASGGEFTSSESTNFSFSSDSSAGSGHSSSHTDSYYAATGGLSGDALKTALYKLIKEHRSQSYSALWSFYSTYEQDQYYENDASIVDIYSERPNARDPYLFTPSSDQCGSYTGEGDCYNREHSFPRSWFGGAVAPMNTDIHHVFPTDGKVNAYRSSYPYGEVGTATYTSKNGSKLGSAASGLGYSGMVFEPIDEFKGDIARAYFYMATRYQNLIANWENNSRYGNAVLDGSSEQVFEAWTLQMLKDWNNADPVSQKERDRNDAAFIFQGNRNPFVDHPEYIAEIWGN